MPVALCVHCKVPVHYVGGKVEHVLPPYVWCIRKLKRLGTKATWPR